MAELNLKQIIDRLNAEFVGDTRKLVFWYDDKADFAEDLENVELENAKIYRLQPDNQFYTKYFLERVDTTTNYLVYARSPSPMCGKPLGGHPAVLPAVLCRPCLAAVGRPWH